MSEVEAEAERIVVRIKMGRCFILKDATDAAPATILRRQEEGIFAVKIEMGQKPNFTWTGRNSDEGDLNLRALPHEIEFNRTIEPDGQSTYYLRYTVGADSQPEGGVYAFWLQETGEDREKNHVERVHAVLRQDTIRRRQAEQDSQEGPSTARNRRLSEESTPSPSVDEAGPSAPPPQVVAPQPASREDAAAQASPGREASIIAGMMSESICRSAEQQAGKIQVIIANAGVADQPPRPLDGPQEPVGEVAAPVEEEPQEAERQLARAASNHGNDPDAPAAKRNRPNDQE